MIHRHKNRLRVRTKVGLIGDGLGGDVVDIHVYMNTCITAYINIHIQRHFIGPRGVYRVYRYFTVYIEHVRLVRIFCGVI